MKVLRTKKSFLATLILVGVFYATAAYAQVDLGMPSAAQDQLLLGPEHDQQHPNMPFSQTQHSNKYQEGPPSELRKEGDLGDPNGCNLKCPDEQKFFKDLQN